MSRALDGATQYLKSTNPRPSTGALSAAGWFKPTRNTAFEPLMTLADAGTGSWRIDFRGDQAGDLVWATSTGESRSVASPTLNAWNHVLMTKIGSQVYVWLNGVQGTLDSAGGIQSIGTTGTPLVFGSWQNAPATFTGKFAGELANWAMWDVATLATAEIAALAAGRSPKKVRPQNLVDYWAFENSAAPGNGIRGVDLTDVGSTLGGAGPRIFR